MATLLQDTFTGSNGTDLTAHAMDVGGGWTALAGQYVIQSNKARANTAETRMFYTADAGQADFTATLNQDIPSGGVKHSEGFCLRMSDVNTGWVAIVQDTGPGAPAVQIYERSGGVNTLRASTSVSDTGFPGSTVTLTLTASGNTLTFASSHDPTNSVSYGSASSNNTVTKHGLRHAWLASAGFTPVGDCDNFLVTGAAATYQPGTRLALTGVGG